MLHKRIDSLENASSLGNQTKLFNRAETEERIRAATPGEYCLLLVRVNGFHRAAVQLRADSPGS